jgi:hypothetical protein
MIDDLPLFQPTPLQRRILDAAVEIQGCTPDTVEFLHAVLCQVGLPSLLGGQCDGELLCHGAAGLPPGWFQKERLPSKNREKHRVRKTPSSSLPQGGRARNQARRKSAGPEP